MLASDASSAVAWLHRLFRIDRAHLHMFAAVLGLELEEPASLVNGVRLLPLAQAPDSAYVRLLARYYQGIPWWAVDIA
jgi:hypothetical protein